MSTYVLKIMEQKKLTISVGTSAFNEKQNIINMLNSVISQKELTVKIVEIIVVSDGSTDQTAKLAKSVKDRRIKVINEDKKLGQPSRIAQLLKMFKGDVFVLIDADMIMKDKDTIEKMVSGFRTDKELALVCGEALPLKAQTFVESLRNNYIYARRSLESEYSFGNTAYGAHAFLAYSKKFGKSLNLPKEVLNSDAFSYFTCKANGYKTSFAKDAVALYRSPASVKDYINQSTRHIAGGLQLKKYFGEEMVNTGFSVPKPILTKLMFYQLRKNPIKYFVSKILNSYCVYLSRRDGSLESKWTEVKSSKNLL